MGCSGSAEVEQVHVSAVEHGRELFSDPRASSSASNAFACSTCHPDGAADGRIYAGASLAGATTRSSFWGGARVDLLESINDCRLSFMDARTPWTREDEDARAMFAYLSTLPGSSTPPPFSVVYAAPDLPPGDARRGANAYARACSPCHGAVHDGKSRLAAFAPILPDQVDLAHSSFTLLDRRLVFLRKIREGAFVSPVGSMPPFSHEVLSDDDVAAILSFLGQYE